MHTIVAQTLLFLRENAATQLRMAWCDLHGEFHCKTMLPSAFEASLTDGVRMAATLLLKDRAGRTALPVFDAAAMAKWGALASFTGASDIHLMPDLSRLRMLPWAAGVAWVPCIAISEQAPDPRTSLVRATNALAKRGWQLNIGLEIEFHVYRKPGVANAAVEPLHPGFQLLSERSADSCHVVFDVIQSTCASLNLPLTSLEIEMGPSQFEAVFAVQDALKAADCLALFRSSTQLALARAGYIASFGCRPPFEHVSSSGWHLHQSLSSLDAGKALFSPTDKDSDSPLSSIGLAYLAGLLDHTPALTAVAVPSIGGYARFAPNRLAPSELSWGVDSRSSLLRVVGHGASARIENRLGTPDANPYLTIATQLQAGLDGIDRQLPTPSPNTGLGRLPSTLVDALNALASDLTITDALGPQMHSVFNAVKTQEAKDFTASTDRSTWLATEFFGPV